MQVRFRAGCWSPGPLHMELMLLDALMDEAMQTANPWLRLTCIFSHDGIRRRRRSLKRRSPPRSQQHPRSRSLSQTCLT